MFWKKPIPSVSLQDLDGVIKRLNTLEARFNALEIENETLRNKVLRKIQQKRDEISSETPQPSQNIYTSNPFLPNI